jgi:hypothetical protein
MEQVYQVAHLLIEAKDAPEAVKFARLLEAYGWPNIIIRPTDLELTEAKLNAARALKIISDKLIRKD